MKISILKHIAQHAGARGAETTHAASAILRKESESIVTITPNLNTSHGFPARNTQPHESPAYGKNVRVSCLSICLHE